MEAYIKKACEQFETLLREQLARSEKMKENAGATDFANAKKIVIGSQARRKSLCEFAKKKRRLESFALCGSRGGLLALHPASF